MWVSFVRPTLTELVDRVRGDIKTRVDSFGSLLRRSIADVFGVAFAGAVHMLHGHLEWLALQLFPDTADGDYIVRQAGLYGLTRTAATYSTGTVTATGTNGTVIPVGTILVRDDAVRYATTAEATIAAGTASLTVEAEVAGADGDFDPAETLTFESPIAGVDAAATVATGGLRGGSDEEDDDALRNRLVLRLQEPPQGGNAADYEAWALAVAGVTRAWVYPLEGGAGTVTVRFVRDDDVSIFPDASEVTAVQTAIDLERPITAAVTVVAPTELATAFTISVTPNTSAVKAAVEAALVDLFYEDGAPGDGAGLGTIKLSRIHTAIGTAEGVTDYTLTVPAANVVPALGQLPTKGTVTWA